MSLGQQVGRALDTPEGATDRTRDAAGERGLPAARHILHEHMTARQQAGDNKFDSRTPTVHDLLDIGHQPRAERHRVGSGAGRAGRRHVVGRQRVKQLAGHGVLRSVG